jgi:hypothetical protein
MTLKNMQLELQEQSVLLFTKIQYSMKSSTSSFGAIHPVLFFSFMYFIALIFSIFICSSLFHAFSASTSKTSANKTPLSTIKTSNTALAYR